MRSHLLVLTWKDSAIVYRKEMMLIYIHRYCTDTFSLYAFGDEKGFAGGQYLTRQSKNRSMICIIHAVFMGKEFKINPEWNTSY